jgi:large subunit ribosomal protein L18
MAKKSKIESRKIRHRSLRKRISGTPERPRLVVFRSAKHIYVQVVDDMARRTLLGASDVVPKAEAGAAGGDSKKVRKLDRAKSVGTTVAKLCLEKGISKVVFDRAGYRYHGRISALATGAREAGLQF